MKVRKKKGVNRKAVFFTALAAGLAGGAYLLFRKLRKERQDSESSFIEERPTANAATQKKLLSFSSRDSFPLGNGSRGERVRVLQEALRGYKGNETLKADGIFGSDTLRALQRAGFNTPISEETYSKITQKSSIMLMEPGEVAKKLHQAALQKRVEETISLLREIKNVEQYSKVNDKYRQVSEQRTFVTTTIVTDLLNRFRFNQEARARIISEFSRIGLKQSSDGKWSLSGIRWNESLITIAPTYIIDWMGNRVPIKERTVLGKEKWIINGMTFFEGNDGKLYRVPSKDIQYIN